MNLQGKTVLAHKGRFDRASIETYKENSVEVCRIAAGKDYIDIIEVDVRKSKDGVLYCYHGSLFEYWFVLGAARNWDELKSKYGVDTLAEILAVIPDNKSLCLDIKDKSITR